MMMILKEIFSEIHEYEGKQQGTGPPNTIEAQITPPPSIRFFNSFFQFFRIMGRI